MNFLFSLRLALFAGLVVALLGCGTNIFPKYTTLGDLRILTVIADPPEANPGDTVTFTPVLSDMNGQGRIINYAVQACIDPGVGIGVTPGCQNPDLSSLQTGTVSIPAGASLTYTGPVPSFSLTMPDATTILASRSLADQYNGVAYLVFYSISIPDGPSVDSFLRVIVSSASKTPKNLNPVMTSVDLNDGPVTGVISMPLSPADFRATAPASSTETYQVMQKDGSFTAQSEELITTWFISDGEFDFSRTIGSTENLWSPPDSKPATRGLVMVAVTRDGRGGAAFRKIEMN